MDVNVNELAARIHEISTGKGFKEPDMDNIVEKLFLSVSELVEALEEVRNGKPLIYYKCGICGAEAPEPTVVHRIPASNGIWKQIIARLGIRDQRLDCDGAIVKPEGLLVEIGDSTIRNLHMLHSLIEVRGSDLPTVAEVLTLKVDFNATRPYMHGGRAF